MAKKRKRKPKVSLCKKKVFLLAAVIFTLCAALIALNVLFTPAPEKSGKTEYTKTETSKENKTTQKKESTASAKKDTSSKSNSAEKNKASVSEKQKTPASSENSETKKRESEKNKSKAAATASSSGTSTSSGSSSESDKTALQKEVEKLAYVQKPQPVEPKPKFTIPRAQKNAVLVFIFDDAGLSVEKTKKYASLPFPVTIAVLPKLSHTKECADTVRKGGKELILHQPMQSMNLSLNPGPGKITAEMSAWEIMKTVRENLDELGPGVKGMNNHEGSLITSDVLKIGFVMDVCDERGLYFLDSRTTAQTQAPQAALERGTLFYEKNAPYIDNVINYDAMLEEIYKCLDVANKKGTAIMIGHVDKSAAILPSLLNEMYPFLVEKGYSFATPGSLKK